ncbi:MAG: glycosyltransferase family 4 protein [Planctomycetota bacterium]|jgi:UDP-GlcNAc:undecaprenyl-phosphate GlcNAc-1-phosphate transferase
MMLFDNIIGPIRPTTWLLRFLPVILVSFIASIAATWLCKKVALKFGIVDKPDDTVKTHNAPIAYLGGVGMFIGLTVGVLAGIVCLRNESFFNPAFKKLLGILAGAAIACFVGLVDDLFDIKPIRKILGCCAAAIMLLAVGIVPNLTYLLGPLHLHLPAAIERVLEYLIVIFFVLGATNSLNLLDGLDGLCAGVTAIIVTAMLFLSIHLATWGYSELGDPIRIIICLALAGGTCGFLPFNRHPAKIFMGDAGSMMLGFSIAALMILFAEQIPRWWFASIIAFGLPILDTAVALVRRLINKRDLFVSDRGHIYDQMLDRGIPLKKTVTICYILATVYALIALVMSQIRTRYAAIVYVFVFLVSGLIVWKKGYLKMQGLRGAIRKSD